MKQPRPTSLAAPIPPVIKRAPLRHDAIAARAHELWVAQSQPENSDKAIWLEAEGQLVEEQSRVQPSLEVVPRQPEARAIASATLAAAPEAVVSSVRHEKTECEAVTAWRNEGDPN